MTRKDFEAIAVALATTRPTSRSKARREAWTYARDEVAYALQITNARFDRQKFLSATETYPSYPQADDVRT